MKRVAIIGGGLAGLVSSILLIRKGFEVTLFEEKKYPFHRVCGEYISNEVVPFLTQHQLYPADLNPSSITAFSLTSPKGNALSAPLDLGGFGVSRYAFDHALYQIAQQEGVSVVFQRVISCESHSDYFQLQLRDEHEVEADWVLGAFGKRSHLDKNLDRSFFHKKYPYVGVKYHIATDEAARDEVALHNFKNGYCGISRVEGDVFNLCYLTHRSNLKEAGSIPEMERQVLMQNPHLKRIYANSDFLFQKPEVINEVSFHPKEPIHKGIFMIGDSAGMIAPLCGNGMAMAIHSAKLACETIVASTEAGESRHMAEERYRRIWSETFASRLWAGRNIQRLFGAPLLTELAVSLSKSIPFLTRSLMKRTHGQPF